MGKKMIVIKREILQNLWDCKYTYIGITMIYSFINYMLTNRQVNMLEANGSNVIIEGYEGITFISGLENIEIPIVWLMTNVFIIIMVTNSINKNFTSSSIYVLTRTKDRSIFWISKLIAIIVDVIVYYIIVFGTFIVIVGTKANIIFSNIEFFSKEISYIQFLSIILILYLTTSILLCFFSVTIAVITKPKYAFFITIVLILISLFFDSFLLPAQGSLLLRHMPFNPDGISVEVSVVYNVLGAMVIGVLGSKFVSNKDIV